MAVVVAVTVSGLAPAAAQSVTTAAGVDKFGPVRQLLVDGYEVKAGFADTASGGAYLVLQKATSAYLCHSSPNQVCEKLN